jgi:hypothetical protein
LALNTFPKPPVSITQLLACRFAGTGTANTAGVAAAAAAAVAALFQHLHPGPTGSEPYPTIFWKSDNQTVLGMYGKNGTKVNSRFKVSLNPEGPSRQEAAKDRARVSAARAQAAAAALLAGDHMLCDCGQAVTELRSRTPKNPGRRFMACPKPRGEVTRCDFFVWADEVEQCRQQQLRQPQQPKHP